jgi:hypothetical protein
MTGPVTTEALVDGLARELARLDGWQDPDALWTDNLGVIARGGAGSPVYLDYVEDARALVAGPLAPLLAAHQQVTAERDEDRAELARLRAEGEAKDRALKEKAEGQVAYWRERQRAEKCLEDGVSEDGQTYTPIGDEAAWQGGYCNGRMSEADWWAKTLQYWPGEAARAATAETAKPAAEAAWPTGCIKPNACSRHRTCVYAMSAEKCRHFGQDLGPAIEAADAARAATAREG